MNKPTSIEDWPKITVYNSDFRQALHNMYCAIDENELWDYLRQNPPHPDKGFMFTISDEITKIGNDPRVQSDLHSGATFAYACRVMELIANIGFSEFCKRETS